MFALIFGLLVGLLIGKYVFSSRNDTPTQPKTINQDSRSRIAAIIRDLANRPEYDQEARTYTELADALEGDRYPRPLSGQEIAATYSVHHETLQSTPSSDVRTKTTSILDNVNTMLFAGAFLVIVSVGILVSADVEAVSDPMRLGLMFVLMLFFYGGGLALYQIHKYRPAGNVFVAIGLALLPLTGIAMQVLLLPDSWLLPVLSVTALLSAVVSFATYQQVRHLYVQFFSIIAGLLTLQFTMMSIDVNYSYIAWIMLIVGTFMMSSSARQKLDDFKLPLVVTSQILIPLVLLVHAGLLADSNQSWWRMGVTFMLSAAFYFVSVKHFATNSSRRVAATITLLLVPVSLMSFVGDILDGDSVQIAFSVILLSLGILYAALAQLIAAKGSKLHWLESLATVPLVLSTISALYLVGIWGWMAGALALIVVLHVWLHQIRSDIAQIALSLASLLTLPMVVIWGVLEWSTDARAWLFALVYMAIGWALIGLAKLRLNTQGLNEVRSLAMGASIFAYAAAAILAGTGTEWLHVSIAFIFALSAVAWWRLFDQPLNIALAAFMTYLGAGQLLMQIPALDGEVALAWFVAATGVGAITYSFSWLSGPNTTSRASTYAWYSGVGVLALGLIVADDTLVNITLYTLAVMVATESWRSHSQLLRTLSVGIGLVAIERTFYLLGLRELQLFTIPWAIYTGRLAWRYHKQQNQSGRDLLVVSSLSILTLPLLMQNIAEPTLAHFSLLIAEAVVLIIAGVQLRYSLSLWWGLGVLLVATFEQLIGLLDIIPNYIITLGAGLVLLGVALKFLQSHND